MKLIKLLLISLVRLFFKIYFLIFGKPKLNKYLEKTVELYIDNGFIEEFALIRLWDAPFEIINKVVPQEGKIVDLGCGDGILTNYLAIASPKRNLVGIELNKSRLKDAYKGLKNTKYEEGDIVKGKYPKADCIILSHVLHHLPSKLDQEKVIIKTKERLKKGGKLVIVEIIEKPLLKLIFTWLTDAFTVPIIFEKKLYDFSFRYRLQSNWIKLLSKTGFRVESERVHKGMPFSHVVFTCEKY